MYCWFISFFYFRTKYMKWKNLLFSFFFFFCSEAKTEYQKTGNKNVFMDLVAKLQRKWPKQNYLCNRNIHCIVTQIKHNKSIVDSTSRIVGLIECTIGYSNYHNITTITTYLDRTKNCDCTMQCRINNWG